MLFRDEAAFRVKNLGHLESKHHESNFENSYLKDFIKFAFCSLASHGASSFGPLGLDKELTVLGLVICALLDATAGSLKLDLVFN
ncbi:hypothetical protein Tco_0217738 [Tanacetum coccineum]